ncbi:MAG: zinc metalloprotease HtpX [Candidatus Latescibacteria bacterium]|nr:zinc metalloprotease HtpX [Candidatus Latescibacterota bacterium]NIM22023.1 zinc metalloprotease HtpX [Candidatus Latescibacterota bacterium]NIM66041.1 zinc metalloprotease HtpX [Candidatus Latescibacterota bacterium]NIO02449.1 zinc metalloprotease HtpX [Candidatus Latescibacterota bacterium]NIO29360.1 zinc metalloprotease HtpX [Candidatus Latescibacterota bacterium]
MNTARTAMLMALMTVLLVIIGQLLGGRQGAIIALVIAAIMNFFSYWSSDKIALMRYRAQLVTRDQAPELHEMVERLAQRGGLPMPKLYVIPSQTPNAFATGRDPQHAAVAVTEGALALLKPDEIAGVIAHELAHVKHRDILVGSIAATLAGAITMLAFWARFAMIFGGARDDRRGGGLELLAMAILAPIAAMLIQMAISRSREYMADAGGAKIAGSARPLANALVKLDDWASKRPMNAGQTTAHMFIVNPLRGGGISSLFSTHPPIEERVRRLREMTI